MAEPVNWTLFNQLFQSIYGRAATDADRGSYANGTFDINAFNPQLVAAMPVAAIANWTPAFAASILSAFPNPTAWPASVTAAITAAASGTGTGTGGTGTGGAGGTGGTAPAVAPRPLDEIFPPGSPVDLANSDITQAEIDRYFPFAGSAADQNLGAVNLLRTMGFDASGSTPMARFMAGIVPDLFNSMRWVTQANQRTPMTPENYVGVPGGGDPGVSLMNTVGALGRGQTSPFANMAGARGFFGAGGGGYDAANLAPNTGTAQQQMFQESMGTPTTAYNFLLDSLRGIFTPQMLQQLGTGNAYNRFYGQYQNAGTTENPLSFFARLFGLS